MSIVFLLISCWILVFVIESGYQQICVLEASKVLDSLLKNIAWIRHERNPVLQPETGGKHGESVCMNPYAQIHDEEVYLYYAADDEKGKRQICLTKALANDIDNFSQKRVLIDNGPTGSFDAAWCVLPNTITLDDVHYIYYTGNNGMGEGLSAFPGIGLATSKDGINYTKNPKNPLLSATGNPGDPDRIGVAGGSLLLAPKADGCFELRYYYTGCPTLGEDYFTDQQKCICYAVSDDGVNWQRRGAVMYRDPQHDYEDVAVAGPFVIYDEEISRYRMWYSAIGTRWGYYSICYAESDNGIEWCRGSEYGENLQLGPALGPVGGLVSGPVMGQPDGCIPDCGAHKAGMAVVLHRKRIWQRRDRNSSCCADARNRV